MPYIPRQQATPGVPIDEDELCAGCGYNLRGLTTDKCCPECGRAIRRRVRTVDVLSEATPAARARWRLALALLGWGVVAITVRQFAWFIWQSIPAVTDSDAAASVLEAAGLAIAICWAIGGWLVTSPLVLGEGRTSLLRWWPFAARWLNVFWLAVVGLQVVRMLPGLSAVAAETAGHIAAGCAVIGSVGAWLLVLLLHRLAEHADQDAGARRLNNALWLLPVLSAVMAGLGFEPIGFWEAILRFILVILPWTWFMMWMGKSILELHTLTSWSLRIEDEKATREERIRAKREALAREAGEVVRATPSLSEGDVPLE